MTIDQAEVRGVVAAAAALAATLALGAAASAAPAAAPPPPAPPPAASEPVAADPVAVAAPAAPAPPTTYEAAIDALLGQPGGLTADACAARAAKVSPSVRRKAAEVALAYAQAKKTELVRVPRVSLSGRFTRLSEVDPLVIPGFGALAPSIVNTFSFDASVNVPLSDYLLSFPSLLKAAKQGEAAARLAERDAVVGVQHEARLAYYEWVRASLQLVVAGQLVTQVDASVGRMQALADVKAVTRADLLRVQAQAASVRQTQAQLKSLARLREQQLRIYIDAPDTEVLTIGEDIRADLAAYVPPAVDDMVAVATTQRLDLKTLDAGIEARKLQRTATVAGKYPKLSAFAAATYADPNQRIFPSRDEFDFTWSAGLQLSWTVNDFLSTGTDVQALDAEAATLEADRERLLDGVRLELESASTAHALALTARAASEEGLAAAEEGYRLRQDLLALQRATAVEIIDAETDLTRARIATIDARIDERVARLRLRHATGEDIQ